MTQATRTTTQLEVELILTRHLSDCLAMPVAIVGVDGEVLHYNDAAAKVAARPFEKGMNVDDMPSLFQITDMQGTPLPPEDRVTAIALRERRPGHRPMRMCGFDGAWRDIELTAFPIEGQGGRLLGAVSIFWETGDALVSYQAERPDQSLPPQNMPLILIRQLASSLVMPIWIIGLDGNVIFYNEPAEDLLAKRYEEAGPMPLGELAAMFRATDEDGTALHTDDLPIATALKQGRPSHRGMRIQGLDGIWRKIEITAFPLVIRSGQTLGAIALFWEEGAM